MSDTLPPMPSLQEQYDLLRTTGEQFDERYRNMLPRDLMLPGDTGPELALYDERVVPNISYMFASDRRVYEALQDVRPDAATQHRTDRLVGRLLKTAGIIVGFSGFGTGKSERNPEGYGYPVEAEAIEYVLDMLGEAELPPTYVIDGGTGYGVPGLSGVIAQRRGPGRPTTLGFAPLRSLRGAAPRDEYVVVGEEWGDEADALGTAPDLLVLMGGDKNARREVHAALDAGTPVLAANLKQYPESSVAYDYANTAKGRTAHQAGQLVVCESLDDIDTAIVNLPLLEEMHTTRAERMVRLSRILDPAA